MSYLNKQLVSKTLIMYMVSALLFLTFVELHIHTHEAALTEVHGAAVSISKLADKLTNNPSNINNSDEIPVNSESIVKVNETGMSLLAVFILLAVLITSFCQIFIGRLREIRHLFSISPFYRTPPLRGPPR